MIDLKKYSEQKVAGLVEIVAAGDSFAVATKKFSPETGADLPDEVIGVNMQELLQKKTELEDEISQINSFIADCNKLTEIVKE